jgi:two-component system NtrC family sensor kinase
MTDARSGLEPAPRVLVVDDVEANLVALEALLDQLDCDVVFARSGNGALRELLKGEFAVMLLDVQMPAMDGYEVAHHARKNPATRDVPIIFLTATDGSEDNVLRGYGSGAVDFLFKPINPAIVRSKVRVFLELYSARRRLAQANTVLDRAYRELQATQAQLVQAAKMASLGELVAGIAHEINNPLAFVISHLDTARRDLSAVQSAVTLPESTRIGWDRASSRLEEMAPGLERIRDLVLKLRTFSRLDEGELKTVSISESIGAVLTILGHRLGDRITVETHYGQPDVIECFPSLLNQAVMNLVANAIEAIPQAGHVTIRTGLVEGEFVISVADTGPGIPEALRQRVLEPFFTTKGVGEGTGLGLSITDSVVKKHGGSLDLRDRAGGGTEAVIRLPHPGTPAR